MVSKDWTRLSGSFLDDGTTPLAQNALDLTNLTGGRSILRARVALELYVAAVSSTGNLVNFQVLNNVDVVMGLIAYDTASPPATSATPITNAADPVGSLGWLQWEPMFGAVSFFKESDVETATVTWRTDPFVVDTQARRRTTGGNTPSVWLAWEIADTSGLINTTTAGTTYALGARYGVELLIETF